MPNRTQQKGQHLEGQFYRRCSLPALFHRRRVGEKRKTGGEKHQQQRSRKGEGGEGKSGRAHRGVNPRNGNLCAYQQENRQIRGDSFFR